MIRALATVEALGQISGVSRAALDTILDTLRDSLELKEQRPFREQDPGPVEPGPVGPPPLLNP